MKYFYKKIFKARIQFKRDQNKCNNQQFQIIEVINTKAKMIKENQSIVKKIIVRDN